MRISLSGVDGILSNLDLFVTHNEESLNFDISSFDKKRFQKFDVFEHINDYWHGLLPHEQDYVFSVYKKIHTAFMEISNRNKLSMALYPLVAELLDVHNFERIKFWLQFHKNVNPPSPEIFKEEYIVNEERTSTREQTYLIHEFFDIRTLSLLLRAVVPIWGEFLARTKKETGTDFKEYYTYQLLCKSEIINSAPMIKLGTYIESSLGQDKAIHTGIVKGISSEEFPTWLTALFLVRRLCTGDIRGLEPKSHLVALLHKYVSHKVNGPANNFTAVVSAKLFKEGEGENNNLSKLEQYKIKQELSAGDIVIMEFIFDDLISIARKLAPTMNPDLLTSALKTTHKLNEQKICQQQIVLVQWVLKPVIPAKSLLYVSKATVVKAIALTQAILIHRGHDLLAAFVSAIEVSDKDTFNVTSAETGGKISKENLDELNEVYPFYKRSGSKQKALQIGATDSKQKLIKPINQAVNSIENLKDMIILNVWKPTIDTKYFQQNHKWIQIPQDIKNRIAILVLELGKRNWKQ